MAPARAPLGGARGGAGGRADSAARQGRGGGGARRCRLCVTAGCATPQGLKVAVVVNDVAKINIDSKLVRERTAGTAGDENMADCVELQNGCACCNASDELLQVRRGAASAHTQTATQPPA